MSKAAYVINREIANLLYDIRKAKKLSQVALAKQLGKPQSFVSKYETGERRLSVGDFIIVCKTLGIKPEQLVKKL